jgi:hypothetical protein
MDRDAVQFIVVGVNDEERTAVPLWLVREVRTMRWNGDWHLAVCTDTRVYMVKMNSADHANRALRKVLALLRAGRSAFMDVDGTVSALAASRSGSE